MLDEVRSRLESRRNGEQPYGDFGMLCAFPPFADHAALRSKSAYPYRYHNGGEWPWLDAVYAAERLRRGLPGWRYPLTRWWSYCLEQGWAGPVEHFSRPFGRGSLLQGWSSLPAAVALALRRPRAGRRSGRGVEVVHAAARIAIAGASRSFRAGQRTCGLRAALSNDDL